MKFAKRIIAAVFAVALGLALVQPIQASRLADAICSNNADDLYAYLKDNDWTREEVDDAVAQTEFYREMGITSCDGYSIRGAWVTPDGALGLIVSVGKQVYLFEFDAFGVLQSIQ